jgi:hypothetical protein
MNNITDILKNEVQAFYKEYQKKLSLEIFSQFKKISQRDKMFIENG